MIGLGISMKGMGCGSDIYLVYHDVPILNFAGKVSILACVLNLSKARLDSAQLGFGVSKQRPTNSILTCTCIRNVES